MRTSRRLPAPWTSPLIPTLTLVLGGLLVAACSGNLPQTRAATPRTKAAPTVRAEMIGPLTKKTPLQIVSVFAYEPREALRSPARELAALIADQRMGSDFGQEPLRTLLLDPPPAPIQAKRLLYIALGPRADFSLERMRAVGATAMHEALRLGGEHMAFAPVVQDQGVTQFAADAVAVAFIDGALVEWDSELRANPQQPRHLMDVTYEAGPAFIQAVTAAVPQGVEAAQARLQRAAGGRSFVSQ